MSKMINMNCPNCGYGLAIPDQYAGRSGRCKKCGATIEVPSVAVSPPSGSSTNDVKKLRQHVSPAPIPEQSQNRSEWFYVVNKTKQGPLDEPTLRQLFVTGDLPPTTLVWQRGLEEWSPANQLSTFLVSQEDVVSQPPALAPETEGQAATPVPESGIGGKLIRYLAYLLFFLMILMKIVKIFVFELTH